MNNEYPFNRMQALQLSRRLRRIYLAFGASLMILGSILFTPHSYANGIDADPTSAPGFGTQTYPAALIAANPGTACTQNGTCQIVWYAGYQDPSVGILPPVSCMVLGPAGATPLRMDGITSAGHNLITPTTDFYIGGSVHTNYCYVSGTWQYQDGSAGHQYEYFDPAHAVSDIAVSTADLTQHTTFNYGTSYNSLGNVTAGTVLLNAGLPSNVTFTSSSGSGAITNRAVYFNVSWAGLSAQPQWLYFFPNGRGTGSCLSGCATYVPIAEAVPLGNISTTASGTSIFSYTYNFSGTYNPTIILSTDCGIFDINTNYNSCNLFQENLAAPVIVSGLPDKDLTYNIELNFPPTGSSRLVNTPQSYEWRIDPANQCYGSSVSNAKIFAGYPGSAGLLDPGIPLTGTGGSSTYTFTHTNKDLGGNFNPYIQVNCDSGTGSTIYYKNTLYKSKATPLIIVPTDFNAYWAQNWVGGQSADYDASTGSGAYFNTDKTTYAINENVLLQYYYNTTFTPSTVIIYPDITNLPLLQYTLTGSAITNKIEHNYTLQYAQSGKYTPMIEVRSASYSSGDPTTFRRVWYGGNTTQNPQKYLTITTALYGASGNTSDDGIFGFPASTFMVSFGWTDNAYLLAVQDNANTIIQGALHIANFAYGVLAASPILTFFNGIIHPPQGASYFMPSQMYNLHWPADPNACVINYPADSGGPAVLGSIFKAMVGGSAILYIASAFF